MALCKILFTLLLAFFVFWSPWSFHPNPQNCSFEIVLQPFALTCESGEGTGLPKI